MKHTTTPPPDILTVMESVDRALDIVISKVPTLAEQASKAKIRPNQTLKAKAASKIAGAALSTPRARLTAEDRTILAGAIQAVEDTTRSVALPPVRVTSVQFQELQNEAAATGRTVSEVIRARLFGRKG